MRKKSFFAGILSTVLVLLIAGCDIAGLLNNAANGSGGFDSALVGTWYYSQANADNGQDAVFTFTSDGRLTGTAFTAGVYNASTSNGRISSTITLNGVTVDSGEADYRVANGTELTFTNAVSGTGGNIFSALTAGGGNYYKPAGSSGNGGNGSGADNSGKNGENGGNGSSGGDSKADDEATPDQPGNNGNSGGSSNPFAGTWWWADDSYYYLYLVIEDYTWELAGFIKGTYTYTGTEARFTATHQWVGKGGTDQAGEPGAPSGDTAVWSVDDGYWEKIEGEVFTVKVSGDRLVITNTDGSNTVLIKESGGSYPGGNSGGSNDMLDPERPAPAYPDGDVGVPEQPADPIPTTPWW